MNPLLFFNQKYDGFINVIAAQLDKLDVVLDKKIGLNIIEILMICLIILSLFWTFE